MSPAKLTPRERRFIEERAKGLNGVQAIKAAGFRGKYADAAASKLLARPRVAAALEAKFQQLAADSKVTQEQWFREVWGIACTKIAPKHIGASDKNKALEMAGRALGAFKDTAGEREMVGPGLTVVVQQIVQQTPAASRTPVAIVNHGDPRLPGPER